MIKVGITLKVKCDLDGPVQPPVDIECPSVGKKLFSHPFSCRKFVICLDGRQFDQDCEHGKHFSYIQEQCVSVEDAQCYIDYNLCPIVDDVFNPFIFASPRDCSVFYSCMLRNIIPGRCAPGLHFNPERLACDFPENVECTVSFIFDDLKN